MIFLSKLDVYALPSTN